VHRDIKPANILLLKEGEERIPKIADFGLARAGVDTGVSLSGYGMGTPAYMPPEQRRDAKSVNHTADLYALGKTLYEMATGLLPDDVDSDKLPPALAEIVKKCVKPDPVERYFSAAELLADLEKVGTGGSKTEDGGRKSAATGAEANACPACGKNNAENVKFCVGCGAGLTLPCPECGADNPVNSPFCGACGTDTIGSARFRDGVTQMEKFAKERQWGRVLKEHGLLPAGLRMPGAKGRELVQRAARLKETADKALEARTALRKTVDSLFNAGQWKDALAKARAYMEDPADIAEAVALVADLEKRVAAEEAGKALAARATLRKTVDSLFKAGQWKEALAKARVYLEGEADNAEAVALVAELEKRVVAEEWKSVKAEAGRLEDAARLEDASKVICAYARGHAGGFYGSEAEAERVRLERLMVLHGDVDRMCWAYDFAGAYKAASKMARAGFSAAGTAAVQKAVEKAQSSFETGRRLWMRRVVRKGAALAAVAVGLVTMVGAVSCVKERNRAQRVSRLWVEAQSAKDAQDWRKMIEVADSILLIRPGHPQVLALRQEATKARLAKAKTDAEVVLKVEHSPGDKGTVDLGGGVKLELVWCPPGSFLMGSPENQADRSKDETQHRVTLTKGFWLGKTEVTQRQWEVIMGSNPSNFKGADLPVETVNWDDCQEFVRKLKAKLANAQTRASPEGLFRLPTEAEWEYACRAGTDGSYAGRLDDMGWYSDNSVKTTHAAGQKRANAWGLYDMHGNVWEWCQDWCGDYPSESVIDPADTVSGSRRVVRGGCWISYASSCRSARRNAGAPDYAINYVGFRVTLSPDQK
jgi:formylglycine-generating enzyme required for sulfatase activity